MEDGKAHQLSQGKYLHLQGANLAPPCPSQITSPLIKYLDFLQLQSKISALILGISWCVLQLLLLKRKECASFHLG